MNSEPYSTEKQVVVEDSPLYLHTPPPTSVPASAPASPAYTTTSVPAYCEDPEVVTETFAYKVAPISETHAAELGPNEPKAGYVDAEASPQHVEQKRYCGMRKRIALIVMAGVVVVIIIAAVVGGVVGSQKKSSTATSNPEESSSGTAADQPQATPTPSVAPSSDFVPLSLSERGIAAGLSNASSSDSTSYTQLFYQDLNSYDIKYKLYWPDTGFQKEQNVSVKYQAKRGTPLTVVSTTNSAGYTMLNLFYLYGNTYIAQADMRCSKNGEDCDLTSNKLISSNSSLVHESSHLAVLQLGDSYGLRLYFQEASGQIYQGTSDSSGSTEWRTGAIGGAAAIGSSITASLGANTAIHVAYVNDDSDARLSYMQYTKGKGWSTPTVVDEDKGTGWTAKAQLTSCYEPTPSNYKIYYVAPSTRKIYSYSKTGATGNWTGTAHSSDWGDSSSSVTAVGWADKVRLLYQVNSTWAMSTLSNSTWGQISLLSD